MALPEHNRAAFDQCDPETQRFINWAFEEIVNHPERLRDFIRGNLKKVAAFYVEHEAEIPELLIAKMIKGGLEHGDPTANPERFEKEQVGEYLDFIGWPLVVMYNEAKKRGEV